MVFFFTTTHDGITWSIYMGRDKYENEDLIKYGTPTDVWFHVDDLSSAHVYLRLPPGYSIDTIPQPVLTDCCALVKANSIEGCKKPSVKIVYTPWTNLKKRGDMDIGQIGFHDTRQLKFMHIEKRNEIVNRLNRTKEEKETSVIREYREEYDRKQRAAERKAKRDAAEASRAAMEQKKKQEEEESYADLFSSSNKMSNQNMRVTAEEYENDFM